MKSIKTNTNFPKEIKANKDKQLMQETRHNIPLNPQAK